MTTARIFGSFTNISAAYFKTLKEIVFSPARFAETLSGDEQMPAWTYVVSGCGLVFLVWFAGALVRQGSYPAFMLEVVSLLLIIVSANAYAFFVRCTGAEAPPFVVIRDTYYYAFGTFSTWALVISELFDLLLVRNTIGRSTPTCIERNMDCLLALTDNADAAERFDQLTQLGFGLAEIVYLFLLFPKTNKARFWRMAAGLIGVLPINIVITNDLMGPLLDYLKARNLWG